MENAGNNFRSFAGGLAASISSNINPGAESYIAGGTVNGGNTIEYLNELPSKPAVYIGLDVPAAGNYHIAAGGQGAQIFSFNWIRQRAYPPAGVMPTVTVGAVTPSSGSAVNLQSYMPVTITNSQSTILPVGFQADLNVTSNSPSLTSGTTTGGTSNTVLMDTAASWVPSAYVGDFLKYTSGPASGQWLQITANTATTITTTASFSPPPTMAGNDNFVVNSGIQKYESSLLQNVAFFYCPGACATTATLIPSWLESGNSNTASNTVYWLDLPSVTPASGGTQTIYMGFSSTSTNLMSSTGYVGEAPQLSPSYGLYDNGAQVFTFYDNFAGTTLSAQWAPTATYTNDEGTNVALGQLASTTNYQNEVVSTTTPSALNNPSNAVFDSAGNLWVADSGNNRVLEFVPGTAPCAAGQFCNGMPASVVIGQLNFAASGAATTQQRLSNPRGIAFDASGNLWVADTGNSRILEFAPPFTNGELASLELGQPVGLGTYTTGTANTGGISATTLSSPYSLVFGGGNLFVADSGNSRILEYLSPSSLDQAATVAIGQTALNLAATGAGQKNLNTPEGVTFYGGNLWVSDTINNRVLEFAPAFATGEAASLVIGQSAYGVGSPNQNLAYPTASTLFTPQGLAFDASGNLWVADEGNNRVVQFAPTFSTGEAASKAIGQSSFTATGTSAGTTGLDIPRGVTFDSSSNLWTTDAANSRVLEFSGPLSTGEAASIVLGQPNFNGTPNPINLYDPASTAFDSSGNLWVVDSGNNRILEYAFNTYQYYTGQSATLVLGQPNFASNTPGTSQTTLNDPTYIAFDSAGNLWVSDTGNNRVLEYAAPFSNGEAAKVVIGQANFVSGVPATSQTGLTGPHGLAFDSSGNLWVADTSNNRALEYKAPFSNTEIASVVFGQALYTTNTVNNGGLNSASLSAPVGVASYGGNLWVTDSGNNRVLEYTPTFSTFQAAVTVIGQTVFTTNLAGTTANTLRAPTGIGFDYWGDLWVADTGNNRILDYPPLYNSIYSGMAAQIFEGQGTVNAPSYQANQQGTPASFMVNYPLGFSFDPLGNLWIADTGNNRVTGSNTGSLTVDNGVTVRQSTNWEGILTRTTINPQTSIFEVYGYVSSPNNAGQAIGLNAPSATTPTPATPAVAAANSLYSIRTANSLGLNYFSLYNNGAVEGYISVDSIPTITPTVTYLQAASSNAAGCYGAGAPLFYPATTTTCPQTPAATTATSVFWVVRNSSLTLVNSIPGAANERWAASQNVLGWTNVAPFQVEPAVPYFHQYQDTFTFKAGGLVTTIDPGISFTLYGTEFGSQYFPISTFTNVSPTQSWFVDAGSTVLFPEIGVGSPSGTRWENSNNQSQTVIVNTAGTCTTLCTATYFKQFQEYLQYKTSDSSVLPPSPTPTLTYYSFGYKTNVVITTSTAIKWVDALTMANATGLIPGGSNYERWVLPTSDWVMSCSNTQTLACLNFGGLTTSLTSATTLRDTNASWIPNQWVGYYLTYNSGPAAGESLLITGNTANTLTTASFSPAPNPNGGDIFSISGGIPAPLIYYHQYLQQVLNYKTSDYGALTSSTVPQITYYINGTKISMTLVSTSGTQKLVWTDAGTNAKRHDDHARVESGPGTVGAGPARRHQRSLAHHRHELRRPRQQLLGDEPDRRHHRTVQQRHDSLRPPVLHHVPDVPDGHRRGPTSHRAVSSTHHDMVRHPSLPSGLDRPSAGQRLADEPLHDRGDQHQRNVGACRVHHGPDLPERLLSVGGLRLGYGRQQRPD